MSNLLKISWWTFLMSLFAVSCDSEVNDQPIGKRMMVMPENLLAMHERVKALPNVVTRDRTFELLRIDPAQNPVDLSVGALGNSETYEFRADEIIEGGVVSWFITLFFERKSLENSSFELSYAEVSYKSNGSYVSVSPSYRGRNLVSCEPTLPSTVSRKQ